MRGQNLKRFFSNICFYLTMDKLAIFFPFILLSISSVGQAVQPKQPCVVVKENEIVKADCANYSLPAVPVSLQINTWQLNLDHNKLDLSAPSTHFSKYVNLRHLTIGNNDLKSIHHETFKYLKHLQYLNLWGNRLDEVPSRALSELRALRTLNLEGNHIKIIRKDAFYNLNNLTELKLSGNHITQVEMGALSGLVKLQHFQIQHNTVSYLPARLFEDCEQDLQTLLLFANPWQCDCKLRWLVEYIRSANISWTNKNQVPRCEATAKRDEFPLLSVQIHEFACHVMMDSSSIKITKDRGQNITLMCKVQSDPLANITWSFNDRLLKSAHGYFIQETGGVNNQNSILFIENLNPQNVGEYKCLAKNPISQNSVIYTLAIEGAKFPPQPRVDKKRNEDDSANIMVAIVTVCVLGGVIFLSVLAFIFWRRFTKHQREKEEELKLKIKKHFESNGGLKVDADNNKCPPEHADNDEMDPYYDTLKKPIDNIEPLFEKIAHLPNGGTYLSFRTDPLDSEVNAPSTILTNLDSQSDHNGMFWTEVSRNDTSSNLSELACPLLDTPTGYDAGLDSWDHSSGVFPHLYNTSSYTSSYPRHPGTFNSIHSFHPYTHDSSNSMTLNSPSNMDILPRDMYNRSFSAATSQSGSVEDHNKRSVSVGSLSLVAIPPKKPPRLHSCSSIAPSDKLTLPKPGSIDEFGTAV